MSLYAMSATIPNHGNVTSLGKGFSYYLSCGRNILMVIVFLVGLFLVLKRIKENKKNSFMKIISFLVPIFGFILLLVYQKKDHQEATEYLKIALIGTGTYLLMFLTIFVTFLISFFGVTAG